MFLPKTIRKFCILAMLLSGLIIFLYSYDLIQIKRTLRFFQVYRIYNIIIIMTWGVLLLSSLLCFKLSRYHLYENEFRKLGISIYLIVAYALFVLFGSIGYIPDVIFSVLVSGLIGSAVLLFKLWILKRTHDDWAQL